MTCVSTASQMKDAMDQGLETESAYLMAGPQQIMECRMITVSLHTQRCHEKCGKQALVEFEVMFNYSVSILEQGRIKEQIHTMKK